MDPVGSFTDFTGTGNAFGLPFVPSAATDPTGMLTSGLSSMTMQYAAQQEADLDWAMDWSAPDHGHSRLDNKWVTLSFLEGVGEHFGIDWMWNGRAGGSGGDGPAMAGVAGGGKAGKGRSKLKGVPRHVYNMLKKEFKANKMRYWRREMAERGNKYLPEQRQRVRIENKPPRDGKNIPMDIHHKKGLYEGGTNEFDNLEFLTEEAHRRGANFKIKHSGLFK